MFGDDWGRHPSTIQHIGRVLTQTNRILWVNTLGSRRPSLQWYDVKRIVGRLGAFVKPLKTAVTHPAVSIVQPFVVPFFDLPVVGRLNNRLLSWLLARKLTELSFRRPIVISATPLTADLVGTFGESSSYYLCLDDYTAFDGVFKVFGTMEARALERVDCMFAISESLLLARRPKCRRGVFLPQGVDTGHFDSVAKPIPDIMQSFRKPIVGFFGLIAPWINSDLILKCANQYPDASFVLIGKVGIDEKLFRSAKNVHLLGEIPYEDLPCYAQAFDVGLIPFKKNELTIASNPLKMLEYLSLGLPVVSTDLPEVKRFDDVVHVASSDEEFIRLIRTALDNNTPSDRVERRGRALEYSWAKITEMLSTVIEEVENS